MFVRKKLNKSGSTSVQVLKKVGNSNKLVKTIGVSKDDYQIKLLVQEGKEFIKKFQGQLTFPLFKDTHYKENLLQLIHNNSSIRVVGPDLVLGKIFDNIGFNSINEPLLKRLVISRIVHPASKLSTVNYWHMNNESTVSTQTIYRFLDKLNTYYKSKIEQITYNYTKKILSTISVLFYDMTTIYFNIKHEDTFRLRGYSKDGKFQKPQILLGLLVGEGGYPIGYDIFPGNTFEGVTMLPMIERFQKKYGFKKPIIVADSGLLSKRNILLLEKHGYQFILGARIKNETNDIKSTILTKAIHARDGQSFIVKKGNYRLIVSYSKHRAEKDKKNRERGLSKLKTKIKNGRLTKASINNRGYNKFLKLNGNVSVSLDTKLIKEDSKWDGLKGYLTNTNLTKDSVIKNYSNLWTIERAFRISKNDLRIRPIFHHKRTRIEAHICLSFIAYTVYKELERLLKKHKSYLTVWQAIELLDTIYEVSIYLPDSPKPISVLSSLSDPQKELLRVTHC